MLYGFGPPDHLLFATLYRETYGVTDPVKHFLLRTGRYGSIPVLPPERKPLNPASASVSIQDLQDADAVEKWSGDRYLPWYGDNALALRAGQVTVLLNSNEDRDQDRIYDIPFAQDGLVRGMRGSLCLQKYIVAKEEGAGRLWLQANVSILGPSTQTDADGRVVPGTWATRDTVITFRCSEKPDVEVQPPGALAASDWDAAAGDLQLVLSHAHGAAEVVLSDPRR